MSCFKTRAALLAGCIGLAVTSAAPSEAQQAYPNQRVNMLIGFAAGGFADTIGRLVATRLSERLGQTFIAQNLPGGGSVRASRQVAVATPDGYTLLVTTTATAINETLVPTRGYAADKLEAIAIPVTAPESLSANPKAPIKSMSDLITEAKAGRVYLGSPGIGSGSHIAAEYFFKVILKAEVRHIPFAGGNPAMLGLMSGDVNVLASTATGGTIRSIANGDITGIAIAGKQRSTIIPKTPTFAELGYAGFEAASWVGFFAPAGTPKDILEKLNAEINAIVQEPDNRKRIDAAGLEIIIRDRPETAGYFTSEIANWSKMVGALGITQ